MKKLINGLMIVAIAVLVGCASGGGSPAVGAWAVNMNTPVGAIPVVITINADGSGLMTAEGLGEAAISGIVLEGNTVAFEAELDAMGQVIALQFTGTVDGDTLEGEFGTDFGALVVSGTRQ